MGDSAQGIHAWNFKASAELPLARLVASADGEGKERPKGQDETRLRTDEGQDRRGSGHGRERPAIGAPAPLLWERRERNTSSAMAMLA
jgi:hypothetical protein